MLKIKQKRYSGFILIEAMVAVLIVALGILALSKLEAMVMSTAGESRARSEAMALARIKMDELRNVIVQSQYAANFPTSPISGNDTPDSPSGSPTAYKRYWTYKKNGTLSQTLVKIEVRWTGSSGNVQNVYLNSIVGWDDTAAEVALTKNTGGNLITPTGSAKRGTGVYKPGDVVKKVTTADGYTRLQDSTGNDILFSPPGPGGPQAFAEIHGRVYFDQTAVDVPEPDKVYVRLSSEGECIYDHKAENLISVRDESGLMYKYFKYVCYVGAGWYGSVGVSVIGDSGPGPNVCVGDYQVSDTSKTASPYVVSSAIRSYRGFREATIGGVKVYKTTGMPVGYVTDDESRGFYGDDSDDKTKGDGKPRPSDYEVFGISNDADNNYFRQDFLLTKSNLACKSQMNLIAEPELPAEGNPSPNGGKYVCIYPDGYVPEGGSDAFSPACPDLWPGLGGAAGGCMVTISGSQKDKSGDVTYLTDSGKMGTCSTGKGLGNTTYSCEAIEITASEMITITSVRQFTERSVKKTETCSKKTGELSCGQVVTDFLLNTGCVTV